MQITDSETLLLEHKKSRIGANYTAESERSE